MYFETSMLLHWAHLKNFPQAIYLLTTTLLINLAIYFKITKYAKKNPISCTYLEYNLVLIKILGTFVLNYLLLLLLLLYANCHAKLSNSQWLDKKSTDSILYCLPCD